MQNFRFRTLSAVSEGDAKDCFKKIRRTKMADCNKTENYLETKLRMCNSFGHCSSCPACVKPEYNCLLNSDIFERGTKINEDKVFK